MKSTKKYILIIDELLKEYKANVDKMEKEYLQELSRIRQEAESMRGKWTSDYQAEYIMSNSPDMKYKEKFSSLRNIAKPKVDFYLSLINKKIERYFKAPVKQDFVNKITAIKTMGVSLSDEEFRMLESEAKSYMEMRLLMQLEESRTKEQMVTKLDTNGNLSQVLEKIPDAYGWDKERMPSIEGATIAFKDLKNRAEHLLNIYAGEKGAMWKLVEEEGIEQMNCLAADSFIVNNAADEFIKSIEIYSRYGFGSDKTIGLTEQEEKLIDVLIDKRYPSMAKEKVKEICQNSPELAELLLTDNRYKEYAKEALEKETKNEI